MRALINIVNGHQRIDEGVTDKARMMLDKAMTVIGNRYISYDTAIKAYDKIEELTGKPHPFVKREQIAVAGKIVKDVARLIVGQAIALQYVVQAAPEITGGIAAISTAIMAAANVYLNQAHREYVVATADREEAREYEREAWEILKGRAHPVLGASEKWRARQDVNGAL